MLVRVSDPKLLRDLLDFLQRAECVAVQAGANTADVFVPRAFDEAQAQRELELYLATWRARHPGVGAELV